jgi:CRP-like cAMP-binding protein
MIHPDRLSHLSFFGQFDEYHRASIAEIAEEEEIAQGITLFEEKQPANALYFLIEGYIDLYQRTFDTYYPTLSKDLLVGAVHPREIFGLSAMVEPYIYKSTARTAQPCRYIRFDGAKLRTLIDEDCRLGYILMREVSMALRDRLMDTRVELAAAWVESQKK